MKRLVVLSLTILTLTIFLTGCCGGKDTVVVEKPAEATTGQQLQDLKAAHDQGAITDKEFEEQKEKILKEK